MKITIPISCKEKLTSKNFCAKCQHKITDFSNLTNDEISNEFQKSNVHCGVFHPSQLGQNLFKKTISNVIIFSALGLMTSSVQGQDKITCTEPLAPKNDSIQVERISFRLIVDKTSNSKIQQFSTFRLLINNEVVKQSLKVGEEYTIKFDVHKGLPIDIRLASNENNVEITKSYTKQNLPKKVKVSSNDFIMEPMIMGKISIAPMVKEKVVVTE
ncbi:hypothetical protein [Empedobacter tilapiae]